MVALTAGLRDELAGVAGEGYSGSPTQVRFRSPSGAQFVDGLFTHRELVSGTLLDGVFRYEVTLPQFSEQGAWTVESFLLVDQVGNTDRLYPGDLAAAGMPTTFTITG